MRIIRFFQVSFQIYYHFKLIRYKCQFYLHHLGFDMMLKRRFLDHYHCLSEIHAKVLISSIWTYLIFLIFVFMGINVLKLRRVDRIIMVISDTGLLLKILLDFVVRILLDLFCFLLLSFVNKTVREITIYY